MRAMMLILGQMPLRKERFDLLVRQPIAEFDGGLTGNHVQQFIDEIPRLGLPPALEEFFHELP